MAVRRIRNKAVKGQHNPPFNALTKCLLSSLPVLMPFPGMALSCGFQVGSQRSFGLLPLWWAYIGDGGVADL
jgi:hypothetical protein